MRTSYVVPKRAQRRNAVDMPAKASRIKGLCLVDLNRLRRSTAVGNECIERLKSFLVIRGHTYGMKQPHTAWDYHHAQQYDRSSQTLGPIPAAPRHFDMPASDLFASVQYLRRQFILKAVISRVS